jgi:uncharacterized protein (TIGR03437 family)
MTRLSRLFSPAFLIAFLLPAAFAQTSVLTCVSSAVPPVTRGEGLAERVGDIVLECAGGLPSQRVIGNFSIFLNVNITNRLVGNNVTGVDFTIDNGSGPLPANVPGTLAGPSSVVYNGLSFTLSPLGKATLRIAGIRAAASELNLVVYSAIAAFLGFNPGNEIPLSSSQLNVGTVLPSLFTGFSGKLICSQNGARLPDTLTFSNLIASNAVFTTTRVTEGFADAFGPRSAWAYLHADSGQRIIIRYGGFPPGARLLVPDVVAGSDAVRPTAGGDFGPAASGGQFAPSANGTLLLARVQGADANGAGGTPVFTPGAIGSGTVSFDSVSDVVLTGSSGFVVYEVVDANPGVRESAQFPTFLGILPNGNGVSVQTSEDVFLAPVSNVMTASATAPIPRFLPLDPPSDCTVVGDCGASFFPVLFVDTTPINFTAAAGSNFQVAYVRVNNQGGGVLRWSTTINYKNGSGWLRVSPTDGVNNATVRVDALPGNLAPGTYQATLVVDGGPIAGTRSVPITLVITPAAPAPTPTPTPVVAAPVPTIKGVMNAASFVSGPVSAGSLATLMGSNFAGKLVSVTFDGVPATVLFSNGTQINLQVPPELSAKSSAQAIVTVDGIAGGAQAVALTALSPAIFPGAVLNQDYSANGDSAPAAAGSVAQIFATGLANASRITAHIHDRDIDVPYFAGPAPGLLGVQQIDIVIPADLPAMTTEVQVCGVVGDQKVCSPSAKITLSHATP